MEARQMSRMKRFMTGNSFSVGGEKHSKTRYLFGQSFLSTSAKKNAHLTVSQAYIAVNSLF